MTTEFGFHYGNKHPEETFIASRTKQATYGHGKVIQGDSLSRKYRMYDIMKYSTCDKWQVFLVPAMHRTRK